MTPTAAVTEVSHPLVRYHLARLRDASTPALYQRAQVAFVGGSLVSVGGHNVLEPALAGCPVLFGRHTANVAQAVEILEASGAGWRVGGSDEMARALTVLLSDPAAARARGEAGVRALAHHRGSAQRSAELVLDTLAARGEQASS